MKEICRREYPVDIGLAIIEQDIIQMKQSGWEKTFRHFVMIVEFEREIPEPPAETTNVQRAIAIAEEKCCCGHEYWMHYNLGGACDCMGCECQKFTSNSPTELDTTAIHNARRKYADFHESNP
jgi:hypothetical protein